MIEQLIRHHYQNLLVDPIAIKTKKYLTPGKITCMATIIGILIIPALFFNFYKCAVVILLLSGFLDTLDGTVARLTKQISDFGSVLDIMSDRIVEFAVVFGLWLINPPQRSLLCLLMLGSILMCITSFLVVGIFTANKSQKSFYYSPGSIERPEAFIFFILMILLPNYFIIITLIFILLVLLTSIVRLWEFYKNQLHKEM